MDIRDGSQKNFFIPKLLVSTLLSCCLFFLAESSYASVVFHAIKLESSTTNWIWEQSEAEDLLLQNQGRPAWAKVENGFLVRGR